MPLTHPEYYEEMGIKSPKGVILYGAPGTGLISLHFKIFTHICKLNPQLIIDYYFYINYLFVIIFNDNKNNKYL